MDTAVYYLQSLLLSVPSAAVLVSVGSKDSDSIIDYAINTLDRWSCHLEVLATYYRNCVKGLLKASGSIALKDHRAKGEKANCIDYSS